MQDALFVIVVLAFFTVAAGMVRLCDRIVGAVETPATATADQATAQETKAA